MAFTASLMAMVGGPTNKTTVGDNGDWAVILVISMFAFCEILWVRCDTPKCEHVFFCCVM